ncbi:MAG: hypothetical protein KKE17_12025 [Proteobacteria bacterium]|nr:hypothetical protein [Pseudomonadota bacterium]MBU1710724.1 hypothetical protein [Pseudomonadota bacterium]
MNRPQTRITISIITVLLLFSGFGSLALAESATNCHCFKDRSYNPAKPFAADDYILATAFNSFVSKAFNIPKKEIVMLKMKQGVGQNDLLIGLKIAATTGVDLKELLSQRKQGKSWSAIISDPAMNESLQKNPLLQSIKSEISMDQAAAEVADQSLANFFSIPIETIRKIKTSGLNEKELALVFILAHAGEQNPETLVSQFKKDGKSWSAIAKGIGINPQAAGELILQFPDKKLPR